MLWCPLDTRPPVLQLKMDNWLASNDARRAKQARSETPKQEQLDMQMVGKLLMLLSKLSLRHSLEIHELQSATFKTIILEKGSSYVSEAQGATRSFTEKAKDAREKRNYKALEELGEPQYHSWAAMVKVAISMEGVAPADLDILKTHFDAVGSVADLVDRVFIAKVKRCFDKKMSKIHFAVCAELAPVLDALLRAMCLVGGKIKRGQPPRSSNDRELQELVDQLAKIVKDD